MIHEEKLLKMQGTDETSSLNTCKTLSPTGEHEKPSYMRLYLR